MRWFLSSFAWLWLAFTLFGDASWEFYIGGFWRDREELPCWKERGAEGPLLFEELSIPETAENISAIEQEIKDWNLNQCLFALRLLVQRDMAKLKSEGSWEEMLKSAPSERNMSCGRCCSPGDERENIAFDIQFMDKVLCGIYNIKNFRQKLKERLEKLTGKTDCILKNMIFLCWYNDREEEVR